MKKMKNAEKSCTSQERAVAISRMRARWRNFFNNVCSNSKFLYSSFYGFTNQDAIAFFEENGTKTKVERGERVFPLSDHSSDVIGALTRKMRALGVRYI